jgi:hypothetical protein
MFYRDGRSFLELVAIESHLLTLLSAQVSSSTNQEFYREKTNYYLNCKKEISKCSECMYKIEKRLFIFEKRDRK